MVDRWWTVGWLLFAEGVRHELVDDGGLTDTRVPNQNDFSLRHVVRSVYVFLNLFVL